MIRWAVVVAVAVVMLPAGFSSGMHTLNALGQKGRWGRWEDRPVRWKIACVEQKSLY